MTYKATLKQWEQVQSWSRDKDISVSCDAACVLELRARVEALEATSKPSPNSSQIGSSLVERVEDALMHEVGLRPMARAAIREVAAWMTSNPDVYFPPALVFAIEQEAER
jgi:hypothetical protein